MAWIHLFILTIACLRSFLCFGLSAEMFQNGESDLITMSCRGICGTGRSLPCNCDIRCTIFKNCCEDFNIVCPSLLNKSLERFQHLENSSVSCNTSLGVSVITSCPSNEIESLEYPILTPKNTGTNDLNLNSSNWEAFNNMLIHFHDTMAVYDVNSGLVYRNRQVHQCNTKGRETNPLFWRRQVAWSNKQTMADLGELAIVLSPNQSVYLPPLAYKTSLKGSECWTDIVHSCTDSFRDTLIAEKCHSVYGLVQIRNYGPIYKNHYCLKCNGQERAGLTPKFHILRQKESPPLSLIVSLTYTQLDLKLESIKGVLVTENRECKIDLESINTIKPCALGKTCDPPQVIDFKGQCLNHTFSLTAAFGEDGVPITLAEETNLKHFAECFLNKHAQVFGDFHYKHGSQMQYFDTTTKTTLHLVTFSGFQGITIEGDDAKVRVLLVLDTMVKLFYAYRLNKAIEAGGGDNITFLNKKVPSPSDYINLNSIPAVWLESVKPEKARLIFQNDFWQGGPEMNNNNNGASVDDDVTVAKITACSCNILLTLNPLNYNPEKSCLLLDCWQTPITKEQVSRLLRLKEASCLNRFEASTSIGGENYNYCLTVKLTFICLFGVVMLNDLP